jgi:GT2 family glycosyltransferase
MTAGWSAVGSKGGDPLEPATLIIPTRNRPELLVTALRSVLGAELVPDEILVVDQSAACDGAVERLAAREGRAIRHEHDSGVGVSRARNLGARLARHEVLLFIDDDVLVLHDWCRAIRSALAAAGNDAVVTGQLAATAPELPGAFAPSTTADMSARTYTEPVDVDVLYTGNVALRRSTLRAAGWFDPRLGPGSRYPAAEDNDLAHRLRVSGVRIVYEPGALVHHRAWRPASELIPLRWRYGRGQGAFLAKHLTDPRGSTGRRLGSQLIRYGRRIARVGFERPGAAGPDVAYLLGLISGAAQWIACERVPTWRAGGIANRSRSR